MRVFFPHSNYFDIPDDVTVYGLEIIIKSLMKTAEFMFDFITCYNMKPMATYDIEKSQLLLVGFVKEKYKDIDKEERNEILKNAINKMIEDQTKDIEK